MKEKPQPRFLKGRFSQGLDPLAQRLNASLYYDWRLIAHDLWQNRVYSEELIRAGIIPRGYRKAIQEGWRRIEKEIRSGTFPFRVEAEDVHLNLELRLKELIGEPAGMIHTGRSRNDQVATVFRLYLRDAGDRIYEELKGFVKLLLRRAWEEAATPFPGYTHLQLAEWVSFGHLLHAYGEMFLRDLERYLNLRSRLNRLPLGSGALAGTGFLLNRERIARNLQFEGVLRNSMDGVADRDFAMEFLGFAHILLLHLSRMMEEFVLFTTFEFGTLELPEEYCTTSSLLPQKKNPDLAELLRGKCGETLGALNELSMVMKGLPLAYNKDLQNDKPAVFRVVESLFLIVPLARGMCEGARVKREGLKKYEGVEGLFVPALLDFLVFERKVPFRRAHEILAELVRRAEKQGVSLQELPERTLKELGIPDPAGFREKLRSFSPLKVLMGKKSRGSPNPRLLRREILRSEKVLEGFPPLKPYLPWAFSLEPPPFGI